MTQLPVMPSDNIYPHLWQRGPIEVRSKPLYHFHLSVLFNGEVHGDCPTQTFVFPSLHHLTVATNALDLAFFQKGYKVTKCGVEALGIEDVRLEDGRTESMVLEYESESGKESWGSFMGRLRDISQAWVVEQ